VDARTSTTLAVAPAFHARRVQRSARTRVSGVEETMRTFVLPFGTLLAAMLVPFAARA
jgi:hypothetical protein